MSSGKHILDYVYANEKKYAGKTWLPNLSVQVTCRRTVGLMR